MSRTGTCREFKRGTGDSFPYGNIHTGAVALRPSGGQKEVALTWWEQLSGWEDGRPLEAPMNQLASANATSDEDAVAFDSSADKITAEVFWMTSRLSVRSAALPWYRWM